MNKQDMTYTDNEFISIIAKLRREGMKVILKDSIYEMDRKQFHGVLEIAKKSVTKAIYAVEKNGIAEMKNETYENKEELRKAVSEYAKNGFKVYYNA